MDPRTARQFAFVAIGLALLALLLAPNGHAEQPSRLDDAAVFFSHRHPTILCPTTLDWAEDPLAPDVCEGTRGAADPRLRPKERAVGILAAHRRMGELSPQYAHPACPLP